MIEKKSKGWEKSAEERLSAVEQEPSAIGYVSFGQLREGTKSLCVNGVAAEAESIQDGTYPLSRPFYLAHIGTLDEAEQDFHTYVKGKGQEIVGKSYVPIGKTTSFLSVKPEGNIRIHGSSSDGPLMEELVAEYCEINPNVTIEIEISDSTDGLNDAMAGKCEFGMASREPADYEQELLDYDMIARDGIAVIVHPDNPLGDITLAALRGIYTGDIRTWKELNP